MTTPALPAIHATTGPASSSTTAAGAPADGATFQTVLGQQRRHHATAEPSPSERAALPHDPDVTDATAGQLAALQWHYLASVGLRTDAATSDPAVLDDASLTLAATPLSPDATPARRPADLADDPDLIDASRLAPSTVAIADPGSPIRLANTDLATAPAAGRPTPSPRATSSLRPDAALPQGAPHSSGAPDSARPDVAAATAFALPATDAAPGYSRAPDTDTASSLRVPDAPLTAGLLTPGAASAAPIALTSAGVHGVPLQHPQWGAALGQQMLHLTQHATKGIHTAELRLDPPDLGPLRITLSLNEHVAHAVFASPHVLVRQTVEAALPQLQQLFEQAGLTLGQTSVNDQHQPSHSGSNPAGTPAGGGATDHIASLDAPDTPDRRSTVSSRLIDTFA